MFAIREILNQRRKLKAQLHGEGRALGAWTSLGHPSITEIFARSGVDFIGIDIEHSTISQEQSQRIIAACHAGGALCLPRIASHNMEMIKRLLDSGADGIIVPMVSSEKDVERLVSWLKYPPKGNRSFGIARAQGYGFDFEEYVATWNDVSSLIIQIESAEGVRNIEAILANKDVDGAMIGPYDLSGSLGVPGQLDHPAVIDAAKKVMMACAECGKACGTQIIEFDLENIRKIFEDGYNFVILSSDIFVLWKWSQKAKSIVDILKGEKNTSKKK